MKARMKNKVEGVTPDTLERLAGEVSDETMKRYGKILSRALRTERGSDAYLNLLAELWVSALVVKTKADTVMKAIDGYCDALPDADDN